jgi:hypothetical protein
VTHERRGAMKRWKLGTLPLTSVMIAAAAVVSAPPAVAGDPAPQRPAAEEPAAAGFDDSFDVFLRGGCGSVPTAYRAAITFVDSGPGVPGNDESNDDYVRIQDPLREWARRQGVGLAQRQTPGVEVQRQGSLQAGDLGSLYPQEGYEREGR